MTPEFRKAPTPAEIRFNLLFPRGVAADFAQLAISPDGQQIVVAPGFGVKQSSPLWLRPLASTSGRLLTGTEGASFPFWSPDGRSIGFFADQKLKRLDVNSQAILILAEPPSRAAAHGTPTARFCSRRTRPVRSFECRRPVASQPSPHTSRPDRTIIERRSSFRMGTTLSTTPEGRRKSAGYTWLASMAPRRSGCSTRTVPLPLFRTELDYSFMTRQQYVVSPDGERFLINAATDAIDPPSITLILNWKATP